MKNKTIHYLYKITFLLGDHKGCYYLGKHSTNNINDNYIGSGLFCSRYFKKYGKIENETYIKEILSYHLEKYISSAENELIGDKWLNDSFCMNMREGGIGGSLKGELNTNYGKKRSEETKQQISESHKGKKVTLPKNNPLTSKVVLQYNKNGDFIKEWVSLREVERQLNIPSGNITACCKNKVKSAGGFIWKYKL
jgi:hypothetical protein